MCGIAGIVSLLPSDHRSIAEMSRALAHRGPDASGLWQNEFVSLAHRRLSIIDVSTAANQPMLSHCGRYVIVFNGEIYNFNKLANRLTHAFPEKYRARGFKTGSDTEIVLELFASEGPAAVSLLEGMFAFVIFDQQTGSLYLFRDRLGIKPLFYAQKDGFFAFASELRSLMKALDSKTVDLDSVACFLHLGYFPEPATLISEAQRFPAANYAVLKDQQLSFQRYWKPEDFVGQPDFRSEEQVLTEFRSLLGQAVGDSMISDVPLGVFLSGGIDSSLVASIAASCSASPIKTFTVSSPDSAHDESQFAKAIARHLCTEHYEMPADEKTLCSLAMPLLGEMDEPMADSSFFPVYIISKFAREKVTVALGGDGGDELFQGYGAYRWANRLNRVWLRMARPLAATALKGRRHAQFFHPETAKSLYSNIFSIEQNLFSSWELPRLRLTLPEGFRQNLLMPKGLLPEEQQAFFDLTHYLKDDLLVKVDRASMLTSLEVRPPLLDHRLVEAALNLPLKYKAGHAKTKILLRKILSEYIPADLFERPKRGFSIPMQRWLRNELSFLPSSYLQDPSLRIFRIVPFDEVQNLLQKWMSGKYNWYFNRVWALVVLSHYLEAHPDIEINSEE